MRPLLLKIEKTVALAAVFSLPFVGLPGIANPWSLPKAAFLLLAAAMLSAVRPASGGGKVAPYAAFAAGGFLAVAVLATAFASDPVGAWYGTLDRGMGLASVAACLAFAWSVAASSVGFAPLANAFVAGAAALALFGTLAGSAVLGFEGRMAATIGQYNEFGAYLAVASAVFAASCVRKSDAAIGAMSRGLAWRVPVHVLLLAGCAASGSRIAVAVASVAAAYESLPLLRSRVSLAGSLAAFAVSASLIAVATLSFIGRASADAANAASVSSRWLLFSDACHAVADRFSFSAPFIATTLFGYGPDSQFSLLVSRYSAKYFEFERLDAVPDRAHNLLADTFLQFGILGTAALFLLLFVLPLATAFRYRKEASGDGFLARAAAFGCLASVAVVSVGFFGIPTLAMSVTFALLSARRENFPAERLGGLSGLMASAISRIPSSRLRMSRVPVRAASAAFSAFCLLAATLVPEISQQREFSAPAHPAASGPGAPKFRDDALAARFLAPRLAEVSSYGRSAPFEGGDSGFRDLCSRDSYFALQVCARYLGIWNAERPESGAGKLLDSAIARLLAVAPSDPFALQVRFERLAETGDPSASEAAAAVLRTFPEFVLREDVALDAYRLRKKAAILERYPVGEWREWAAKNQKGGR